jgi:Transposase DDE domain
MPKKVYRVRNWKEYNKNLIQRGSITLWINENAVKKWHEMEKTTERGRPKIYADTAIETFLVVRALFNLALRQCEGFIKSIFDFLKLEVQVPCYTQVCRRQKELALKVKHAVTGPLHVVVDGTGLKIFGEGEWKVRQFGYTKHRMWRKLHIGIDVKSREIVMEELTDNHTGENKWLKPLLDQYAGDLITVGADKGYDSFECHEEVGKRGARSAILPQRKAKIRKRAKEGGPRLVRDDIVRRMKEVGRKGWKAEVSYHQRSLVENTFGRYKTIFGGKLRSICLESQKTEALIKCNVLNKFTQLGMPVSVLCDR